MPNKKDFEGKNKTKDTYDKDWKLKKIRGPHGTSSMAWITNKQAKQMRAGEKESKAYLQSVFGNQPSAPGTPTPPSTVPIIVQPPPGSPPGTPPIVGDPFPPPTTPTPPTPTPPVPNVPSWWINQAIQNPTTPDAQFANMANALLPTLSPEDQRTLGTYLAQNFKDVYGGYANAKFSDAPTEMTSEWRNSFLNPQRAQMALHLLDRMKTASGAQNMGAGYDFLQNAVKLMNQFNGGGVMTREKYQQFTNAVTNLNKNATGNLAPYANLAQLFNLPSFTAGPLVSNTPNTKLFT